MLHSATEFGWARDAAAFTRGHPRTHVSCASLCSSVRLGMGCCCIYPWPSQDTCKLCFTLPQSLAGQGMLLHLPVAIPGHMSAVLHSAAVLGWAWDAAAFTRGHPRTHVNCAPACSRVGLGMGNCIYTWLSGTHVSCALACSGVKLDVEYCTYPWLSWDAISCALICSRVELSMAQIYSDII